MQTLAIQPISHPLQASVRVPGSKSLTNRALLLAALANGESTLQNALFSDDSLFFIAALKQLGFLMNTDEAARQINITGLGGHIPAKSAELYIGNAGTAARFLSAFLALGTGSYKLDGDTRMRERPLGDLINALQQLGVEINSPTNCPPVTIKANGLRGGKTTVAGNISSQFLSALLMVAPYAKTPLEIEVIGQLNSQPYVEMTLHIMQQFGISAQHNNFQHFFIPQGKYQAQPTYTIESDASAASYFFAAPAICGGSVTVENITRPSLQGDIAFLDVLKSMGLSITHAQNSITVTSVRALNGIDIDMRDIPDTAQTLAIIAPFATSPTRIRGIASARVKETDRIAATCTELIKLGIQVEEHSDGLTIYPCQTIQPASIATYKDHRMAMAFSLIGLRENGIQIKDPACVSKTFPNFFEVLEQLR